MDSPANFRFSTHANRLCIPLGQSPLITKNGLPSSPSLWGDISQIDLSKCDAIRCVFLLGEPGIGKTTEFYHHFTRLRDSGQAAFISNWQNWCEGDDIYSTLDDCDGFHSALATGQTVWWFLDALDEGRIKTERAFVELH